MPKFTLRVFAAGEWRNVLKHLTYEEAIEASLEFTRFTIITEDC